MYADSLAKQLQRCAAANKKEQNQNKREEESICIFVQWALCGFKHDHGGNCSSYWAPCETDKLVSLSLSCQMQASLPPEGSQSSNILAEIGRCYATFHNHAIISWHCRVSDRWTRCYCWATNRDQPEYHGLLLTECDRVFDSLTITKERATNLENETRK